jgi:hypothetical protein
LRTDRSIPDGHVSLSRRLQAGDTAYLVGPYRELLDTLRKSQQPQQAAAVSG